MQYGFGKMGNVYYAMKDFDDAINDTVKTLNDAIGKYNKAIAKDEAKAMKEQSLLLSKYAPTITENNAGVYCIKVNDKVLYVGQSRQIQGRVINHISSIANCIENMMLGESVENKYRILAIAFLENYDLEFVELYQCDTTGLDKNAITENLKEVEMYYIDLYDAPLNTYRPHRCEQPKTLKEAMSKARYHC